MKEQSAPAGTCRVCFGEVIEKIVSVFVGEPIYGPRSRDQTSKRRDGYYCTECGIRYEFPPPPKE